MFTDKIHSTIIWNILIFVLISSGFYLIEPSPNDQAQLNKRLHSTLPFKRALNGLSQKASAEYNFFLLLFGLAHRAKVSVDYPANLSGKFVSVIESMANQNNRSNINTFDRVINGKGPGIDWTKVNSLYTDYSTTLDTVNGMVDAMTRNQSIKMSELEWLLQLAQGVIDYRFRQPETEKKATIIGKWKLIKESLDKILAEPHRFRSWSDRPDIDLFQEKYNKGKSMKKFEFHNDNLIFFPFITLNSVQN